MGSETKMPELNILKMWTGILWREADVNEMMRYFYPVLMAIPEFQKIYPKFKVVTAAKVIWEQNGKILLFQKHLNTIGLLPGGKHELKETNGQALKRECEEEISVAPQQYEPFATMMQFGDGAESNTMFVTTLFTSQDKLIEKVKPIEYPDSITTMWSWTDLRSMGFRVKSISPLTLTQLVIADIKMHPTNYPKQQFQNFHGTCVINALGITDDQ